METNDQFAVTHPACCIGGLKNTERVCGTEGDFNSRGFNLAIEIVVYLAFMESK